MNIEIINHKQQNKHPNIFVHLYQQTKVHYLGSQKDGTNIPISLSTNIIIFSQSTIYQHAQEIPFSEIPVMDKLDGTVFIR